MPPEFGALVGPHLECMFHTARSVLPSDDLAWDAVQETLLQVWRNDRLPERPRGALRRIVLLASLEIRRSLERRRRHEAVGAELHGAQHVCDDPHCAAERAHLRVELDEAVATLPSTCRDAFLLREAQGEDYNAIAEKLDVPVGTVKSRLNRARSLLQRRLGGQLEAPTSMLKRKAG